MRLEAAARLPLVCSGLAFGWAEDRVLDCFREELGNGNRSLDVPKAKDEVGASFERVRFPESQGRCGFRGTWEEGVRKGLEPRTTVRFPDFVRDRRKEIPTLWQLLGR